MTGSPGRARRKGLQGSPAAVKELYKVLQGLIRALKGLIRPLLRAL